jgi:hypothetical protein
MTGDRPDRTPNANLTVRVFGIQADGQPFSQLASAGNLSGEGALLTGLEHELKVGDTIGVLYENKKVRCRVVWVINAGPVQKNQVGLQLLSDQECPWRDELSEDKSRPSPRPNSVSPQNRRRFSRHKLSFPIELRAERVNAPLHASATDVGGNGCYIETLMPLQKGTRLKATFWIDAKKISTAAIVRTCDGGVGMGIEFIGMEEGIRKRLQQHLNTIREAQEQPATETENKGTP